MDCATWGRWRHDGSVQYTREIWEGSFLHQPLEGTDGSPLRIILIPSEGAPVIVITSHKALPPQHFHIGDQAPNPELLNTQTISKLLQTVQTKQPNQISNSQLQKKKKKIFESTSSVQQVGTGFSLRHTKIQQTLQPPDRQLLSLHRFRQLPSVLNSRVLWCSSDSAPDILG